MIKVYMRALLASFLVGGVVLLTAFAQEDALRVCPEGCPFASVQEAIERAEAGAVIRVLPGTYRESLLIDKDVALEGEGADRVELRAPASDEAVVTIRTPQASAGAPPVEVALSGFTFVGGQTGVVVEQASVALRDNRFVDNRNGVDAFGFNFDLWEVEAEFHFERNRVEGNVIGVHLGERAEAELVENEILDNLHYGVALTLEACFGSVPSRFAGAVSGRDNRASGNWRGDFCPPDYPLPEGFFR